MTRSILQQYSIHANLLSQACIIAKQKRAVGRYIYQPCEPLCYNNAGNIPIYINNRRCALTILQ